MGRVSTNSRPAGLGSEQRRNLLAGLLDDASLFPPGNLPMPAAVAAHVSHESAWFSDLTGPFVCPETKLADLGRALTAANTPWIDLSLVVTGGADAVSAATDAVAADPRLRLRAIEVPAAKGADPARADRRRRGSARQRAARRSGRLHRVPARRDRRPGRRPARCSTSPTSTATGPSCAPAG